MSTDNVPSSSAAGPSNLAYQQLRSPSGSPVEQRGPHDGGVDLGTDHPLAPTYSLSAADKGKAPAAHPSSASSAKSSHGKDTGDITMNINVGPSSVLPSHNYAQMLASHMEAGGQGPHLRKTYSQGTSIGGFGAVTPTHEETDPLLLRSKVVNEQEIKRRVSGKGRKAEREVARFYETQNSHINNLLKPMAKHASEDAEDREGAALKVKIAVYASIGANFALAALQLYAAVSSLSLSLFATAADSVFDPVRSRFPSFSKVSHSHHPSFMQFANLVLNWLHRKASKADERKWPSGGSRFESVSRTVKSKSHDCHTDSILSASDRKHRVCVPHGRSLAHSDRRVPSWHRNPQGRRNERPLHPIPRCRRSRFLREASPCNLLLWSPQLLLPSSGPIRGSSQ
jgi:hypothetical protein